MALSLLDGDEGYDQLAADIELVSELAAHGFTGPKYREFEIALCRYALGVMMAWLLSGEIFVRCAEQGRPVTPCAVRLSSEECEQLAIDTVVAALPKFKEKALVKGGWNPDRKTRLTTYFVGWLPSHFLNVYRKKLTEIKKGSLEVPSDDVHELTMSRVTQQEGTDPLEMLIIDERIREGLCGLDLRTRQVLVLSEEGYEQAQIAEALNITPRAVEGTLYRHRQRLRSQREQGGESGAWEGDH
jgi:RNA polymerase sigma factor (sigma-70 family)